MHPHSRWGGLDGPPDVVGRRTQLAPRERQQTAWRRTALRAFAWSTRPSSWRRPQMVSTSRVDWALAERAQSSVEHLRMVRTSRLKSSTSLPSATTSRCLVLRRRSQSSASSAIPIWWCLWDGRARATYASSFMNCCLAATSLGGLSGARTMAGSPSFGRNALTPRWTQRRGSHTSTTRHRRPSTATSSLRISSSALGARRSPTSVSRVSRISQCLVLAQAWNARCRAGRLGIHARITCRRASSRRLEKCTPSVWSYWSCC
mmetsp:Transcript_72530/g.201136  ORF Transcript_72530/g.201136 Transcript_72530/m.201136 type:complete len:261 (+) Transcript_72530:97-879(+)